MKGLQMMLGALGINIDPAQIEQFFRYVQVNFPLAINAVSTGMTELNARLGRIEDRLARMEASLGRTTDSGDSPGGSRSSQ